MYCDLVKTTTERTNIFPENNSAGDSLVQDQRPQSPGHVPPASTAPTNQQGSHKPHVATEHFLLVLRDLKSHTWLMGSMWIQFPVTVPFCHRELLASYVPTKQDRGAFP